MLRRDILETYSNKITPAPTPAKRGDDPGDPATRRHADRAETLGVYVHFPWCLEKCPYCDFLSVAAPRAEIPHEAYADAVCRELRARGPRLSTRHVHSVFFGGGTPSLWRPDQLARVIECLAAELDLPATAEITVECNPTSFTPELARALLRSGVQRVSIGVQGLEQERLTFLGRLHDPAGGLRAVRQALDAGIPRVSADLIYGVHRQEPARAAAEVGHVAELGVSHLSAYALTIEPGTRFGALRDRGSLPLLGEDQVAESFTQVRDELVRRGFHHYETSNFARPGQECRHNLGYWRGEPYLGLGCGAWGTLRQGDSTLRYRNVLSPERYLAIRDWPEADPEAAGPTYPACERLTPETLVSERILLGLRLAEGVCPSVLERELGVEVLTESRRRAAEKLTRQGRLETVDERWRIPSHAWLFADAVIRELI